MHRPEQRAEVRVLDRPLALGAVRRRSTAVVCIAGLTVLASSTPSLASSAKVAWDRFHDGRTVVLLNDAPGAPNAVTATADLSRHIEVVTLRDANARIRPERGCESVDPHEVVCRLEQLTQIRFNLGAGRDRLEVRRFDHKYGSVVAADAGPGRDRLHSSVDSILEGGPGDDVLAGRGAKYGHELCGGPGDDALSAGRGKDYLLGGEGDDILQGGPGDDILAGTWCKLGREAPDPGSDQLDGGPGDDTLTDWDGFGGPDTPFEDEGGPTKVSRDVVLGGTGDDMVESYWRRVGPVVVDLSDRRPDGQFGERDKLVNVEGVIGSLGRDRVIGDNDDNVLSGGGEGFYENSGDVVRGLGGDDYVVLQPGDDATAAAGDDELVVVEDFSDRARCGRGSDSVWFSFQDSNTPGPLLRTDCERVKYDGFALRVAPAEVDESSITFEVLKWDCCDPLLQLTQPNDPFTPFGSGRPRDKRLVVSRPEGETVRAVVTGLRKKSHTMIWRFEQ